MASQELSDEQLRSIYAWIDAIPLSRPKRNMARDFSDGCMFAEVVSAYFPEVVDLHNYSPASNTQQKIYNFETLNQKVLKKFNYQIPRPTIESLVVCKQGVAEIVLNALQFKMAKYRERKSRKGPNSPHSVASARRRNENDVANMHDGEDHRRVNSHQKMPKKHAKASVQSSVDEEILLEKEDQIRELQETVEILELKIAKLEQLVRLKDNKIQKLSQK
mmetsp:Transcript_13359/g.21886  ORF Transcript_13359/g.21886 Transcript_13359/m.21886 type:complete len:219 (+) Transcript_13359:62-718(+)|eukprot:CAMPEP_0114431716 /NCGR_PEP_ID=MMETSP0103-20121206/10758_1 /TAXON_ID=37642 ORGANISM="Paraphysomonas imperforata, Strain PA2" /NCGR_SAMPLE_ID=MMETSP0103 /ASSEMBLY_ACC=CAM_ASM_000201 /LENGTH=218 /DNA_ID=CAMNT_0001601319 /DNA_START=66 /DNA_END=722 /DNA_ORIENTATION=+